MANAGLSALFAADPFDAYHFFCPTQHPEKPFWTGWPRSVRPPRPKIRVLPRTALPASLAETDYHCFHLSDCLTAPGWLAALRNRVARSIFPITGVTHSLSYARFGLAFAQHVWPGVTQRDCIVATSRAGEAVARASWPNPAQAMAGASQPTVTRIPQRAVGILN